MSGWIDFVPSQIGLPLGGLLIALFVGWFVKQEESQGELALRDVRMFRAWYNLLRFVVVPALTVILLTGVAE